MTAIGYDQIKGSITGRITQSHRKEAEIHIVHEGGDVTTIAKWSSPVKASSPIYVRRSGAKGEIMELTKEEFHNLVLLYLNHV